MWPLYYIAKHLSRGRWSDITQGKYLKILDTLQEKGHFTCKIAPKSQEDSYADVVIQFRIHNIHSGLSSVCVGKYSDS